MTEVTATSWSHLYDLIFADSYNPRIDRYKSRFAFRGVSNSSYNLSTSLMRMGGNYKAVEKHILRQFKKYAYQYLPEKESEWYWLSVGQHYGLPTRILDWSYSPDVALHFATSNTDNFNKDGAIWKVNYKLAHEAVPERILGIMKEEKTWILTTDLLSERVKDLRALDEEGNRHGDFVLFFEPPALDSRIYNQFAYFSVMSKPDLPLDEWLANHSSIWSKIIIPARLKWEIRDKLDQRNVSERLLFPGLDGLASWLRRYYLPTGSARP